MTDTAPEIAETLPARPLLQRRGRPPGAQNRRSLDLARWIEHQYGGLTPGQQSAAVALVTPADVEAAPAAARDLGIVDLDLEPLLLALVVKATRLARALKCEAVEAWAILAKERGDLMRYVHQVQPQAKPTSNLPTATVFLVPEGEAREALAQLPGDESQDPDFFDYFDGEPDVVGNVASEADEKP
jgi:hypothetical protein